MEKALDCELCSLVKGDGVKISKLFYRNSIITIVDCKTCKIPMVVFNHCGNAAEREKRLALNAVNELFKYKSIRKVGRKIVGHEHWHLEGASLKEKVPGGE